MKPVQGADGSRVPLLRAGLNSSKAYNVSFVYLSSGSRFGKNGTYDMGLPRLDVPVNLLTWEVSLPDRLEVKQFGGNAFSAELFPTAAQNFLVDGTENNDYEANVWSGVDLSELQPGQVGGIIVDPNGAVVVGAEVIAVNTQTGAKLTTRSDGDGHWMIAGLQPGAATVSISSPGFRTWQQDFQLQASRPVRMGTTLDVGTATATVNITSDTADLEINSRRIENLVQSNRTVQMNTPSQNVVNLQRRVAGVFPVRIDVPSSGKSYRFVRPLVLDEETRITFQYKSR